MLFARKVVRSGEIRLGIIEMIIVMAKFKLKSIRNATARFLKGYKGK